MNEQEFRELSAAHALDALSPDEELAFAEALEAHPEWRAILDADREAAADLGGSVPEAVPPASVRASILDAIAELPQAGSEDPTASGSAAAADPEPAPTTPAPAPRRARGRAGWFALAASIAVLLSIGLSPWVRESLFPQDPVATALEQVEAAPDARSATGTTDTAARGTLHWSDSEQRAVFVLDDLPKAASGHDYELWIVRGDRPISLGVVRPDGSRAAVIAKGFRPGDTVAVTVEDRGGSPTGAPTTAPILAIASA
ncbi:anti-sigma factor [Leucobacter iarius]|uniref:Regulator of SigK n=1 Tax=Leucobacter iarius TaxID=333963 RepID=A0ABN2L5D8_9MICO